MNKLALATSLALFAASSAQSQYIGNNPGNAPWGAGPSGMPKGVKMIVVSGDPAKEGPYTIRLRFPAGYAIGPHKHPTEEQLKVVSGGLTFGFGTSEKRTAVKRLTKGATATVPANAYHFASTSVGATVEFAGTGPFRIDYAQAKDDPRTK
jgi:quercetin dioxygenase-like cupin family protein